MPLTLAISAYILAGGQSSRMGTDKSLLPLAGKPLILHAVTKLSRVCAEVRILSSNPTLASYAPLVADLHPNCGPIGGIEAALAHSSNDWCLIYPVDVPFLPAAILHSWAAAITVPGSPTRVAMFSTDSRPQPAVCLIHKQIAPSIAAAVRLSEFKLLPALESAAEVLALQQELPLEQLLSITPIETVPQVPAAHHAPKSLWFANVNTPEDLADAETHLAALNS